MGVAFYIVLERSIENLDDFVDGKMLARAEPDLNAKARELKVTPLMDFFGFDPEELFEEFGLENLNAVEPFEEKWFKPGDGLKTVTALIGNLEENPGSLIFERDITEDVVIDLRGFQRILREAEKHQVKWRLAIY